MWGTEVGAARGGPQECHTVGLGAVGGERLLDSWSFGGTHWQDSLVDGRWEVREKDRTRGPCEFPAWATGQVVASCEEMLSIWGYTRSRLGRVRYKRQAGYKGRDLRCLWGERKESAGQRENCSRQKRLRAEQKPQWRGRAGLTRREVLHLISVSSHETCSSLWVLPPLLGWLLSCWVLVRGVGATPWPPPSTPGVVPAAPLGHPMLLPIPTHQDGFCRVSNKLTVWPLSWVQIQPSAHVSWSKSGGKRASWVSLWQFWGWEEVQNWCFVYQGVCRGCSIRLGTQETPIGWHPGCETTGEGAGGNGPIPSTDLYGINLPCLVTPVGEMIR